MPDPGTDIASPHTPPKAEGRLTFRRAQLRSLVTLMSIMVLVWFSSDLMYLIQGLKGPRTLGPASRIDVSKLENNTFVSLKAVLDVPRTISFKETHLLLGSSGVHKISPLLDQPRMFLERIVDEKDGQVRGVFEGRLTRRGRLAPSYGKVWAHFKKEMKVDAPAEAWLLVHGERPGDKLWVLAIYVVFPLVIAFNIHKLRRLWISRRS
ncbi:MAG: hypothetical protein PHU25_07555 [Deltaproteobacteria bacterium]|nr:hypothetical protein [Deltaproteobacteria bacterium]